MDEVIYESPDRGETVYARHLGLPKRTLISESPMVKRNNRWRKWSDILFAAETNPTLEDAIHTAEVIYEIVKEEN